ncbi:MAG: hypothetical protein NVSMB52_09100 [Chloroflexota bacterium]
MILSLEGHVFAVHPRMIKSAGPALYGPLSYSGFLSLLRGRETKQHHGTNQLVGEPFRPVCEEGELLPVPGRVNLGT